MVWNIELWRVCLDAPAEKLRKYTTQLNTSCSLIKHNQAGLRSLRMEDRLMHSMWTHICTHTPTQHQFWWQQENTRGCISKLRGAKFTAAVLTVSQNSCKATVHTHGYRPQELDLHPALLSLSEEANKTGHTAVVQRGCMTCVMSYMNRTAWS